MKSMRKAALILLVVTLIVLGGCGQKSESTFDLAPESRLPKWFTLPTGKSRSDVSVAMSYYIDSAGRKSKLTLLDSKKQTIVEVNGTQMGSAPFQLKNPRPGFPAGYPSYEILTVNGITELIEHRQMEPLFYIVDDSEVLNEFGLKR